MWQTTQEHSTHVLWLWVRGYNAGAACSWAKKLIEEVGPRFRGSWWLTVSFVETRCIRTSDVCCLLSLIRQRLGNAKLELLIFDEADADPANTQVRGMHEDIAPLLTRRERMHGEEAVALTWVIPLLTQEKAWHQRRGATWQGQN